jgi:hypothetical protein
MGCRRLRTSLVKDASQNSVFRRLGQQMLRVAPKDGCEAIRPLLFFGAENVSASGEAGNLGTIIRDDNCERALQKRRER